MSSKKDFKFIIGVDEVGRGPIAGPVAVGAICLRTPFSMRQWRSVKDSKQLTEKKREEWFERIIEESGKGQLRYAVSYTTSQRIDREGIIKAIGDALRRALLRFDTDPCSCLVLLDGGLMAPQPFIHQRTIIKGDEKEKVIALASIVAKVTRDRQMVRFSKQYPEYDFHAHKGYGTRRHFQNIRRFGTCAIHRKSFVHV